MPSQQQTIISISKGNIFMMFLGAFIFCIIFIWYLQEGFHGQTSLHPIVVVPLSFMGLLFFSVATIYLIVRFFDKRAGIILDEKGITDHSSLISAGHIAWENVISIESTRISRQYIITIVINNPDVFLKKQPFLKRKIMAMNMRLYRSPVQISPNTLQGNVSHILRALQQAHAQWKKEHGK